MDFWGDERGQPVQIGFILLFGILVLAFAGYQGYVVPDQNAEIEFHHAQTVEDQFTEFDTNVVNTIGNDVERSSSFALGVQYPSRLIALNPPPVSGRLETTAPQRVSIFNGTGHDKTADICGLDQATSRSLVYTPQYNEYSEVRSMTYENTFLTRSFRERDLHVDQRLVRSVDDGPDRIDLLLLNRSVSVDRQGTYNLNIEGTHRYSKTVENATVTISTQFSNQTWEEEILGDRDDVSASDAGTDQVNLTFDGGDYVVSCAVVGLNDEPAFEPPAGDNDSSTFDTRWIEADGVSIDDSTVNVTTNTDSVELTAQALEQETSLPVKNATVDFALEGQQDIGFLIGGVQDRRTDRDGREDIEVDIANNAEGEDEFKVYVTIGDDTDVLTVQVMEAGSGGGQTASEMEVVSGSGTTFWGTEGVEFQVENTGGDSADITGITIEGTTKSQADEVWEESGGSNAQGQHEVFIDSSNDGLLEMDGSPYWDDSGTPLEFDVSKTLTESATFDPGSVGTVYLYTFRNPDGNMVNMSSSTIDVTLEFGDGSSRTYTISIS